MIPLYSRVVAVDDDEDHLQKIVWGLGKAGFCTLPFFFDDGQLEAPPIEPLQGVRIVFTDIHLVGGGIGNEKTHAANIVRCLKKIIAPGPYVLIFWSQYPGEGTRIAELILERAADSGLIPPIGFGAIDKNEVFKIPSQNGDDHFNAGKLRELILEKVRDYKTLAVAASWEERVSRAAASTNDKIFDLVKTSTKPLDDWESLLAFLACEAVGQRVAKEEIVSSLDAALLPLLEDQLSLIGNDATPALDDFQRLLDIVSLDKRPQCPDSVAKSHLNASYLIEEFVSGTKPKMWSRGTVTALGSGFVNSGRYVNAFGHEDGALIRREFATQDLTAEEKRSVKLHVVELGPECDHVQSKVSTHRYLLALLVPVAIMETGAFTQKSKKNFSNSTRYNNESVMNVGKVMLKNHVSGEWFLLISCRCFMALPAENAIEGRPVFRLRRSLIEEVSHRYVTYARRPGVMRFHD